MPPSLSVPSAVNLDPLPCGQLSVAPLGPVNATIHTYKTTVNTHILAAESRAGGGSLLAVQQAVALELDRSPRANTRLANPTCALSGPRLTCRGDRRGGGVCSRAAGAPHVPCAHL